MEVVLNVTGFSVLARRDSFLRGAALQAASSVAWVGEDLVLGWVVEDWGSRMRLGRGKQGF